MALERRKSGFGMGVFPEEDDLVSWSPVKEAKKMSKWESRTRRSRRQQMLQKAACLTMTWKTWRKVEKNSRLLRQEEKEPDSPDCCFEKKQQLLRRRRSLLHPGRVRKRRRVKILRRVSENVLSGTAKLPVHTTRRRPSTRGWVIAQTLARRWLELLG